MYGLVSNDQVAESWSELLVQPLKGMEPATRLGEEARSRRPFVPGISGHSSITITQRYVRPQADAVERTCKAFGNLGAAGEPRKLGVGTILGAIKDCESSHALQTVGAKGGTRTPTGFPARS